MRANETWNHAHPHASLPLAVKSRGPFVRLLFPGGGGGGPSMPIETRRNISGRHEMQCVFGVTVSGPETTLRFAVRFAVAQQRFREFGRKRGVRPLFRDFESSLTLHRFSSFFVFPSRAKIRRRSIVVASPYSFSLSLLLSVFLIIILLSTDEICLMSIWLI